MSGPTHYIKLTPWHQVWHRLTAQEYALQSSDQLDLWHWVIEHIQLKTELVLLLLLVTFVVNPLKVHP